jgi:hypothetical protein
VVESMRWVEVGRGWMRFLGSGWFLRIGRTEYFGHGSFVSGVASYPTRLLAAPRKASAPL